MLLEKLSLTGFRNYRSYGADISAGTTLIVGPNTSGKTNILEAISILSTGKSFRATNDQDMVQWGQEMSRVKGTIGDTTLEIVISRGEVAGIKTPVKKFLVNGISRRVIDFVGNLRTVVFWPEDLDLVTDSPSVRRRYLDRVLIQTDREYRRNLASYEKGLRQRNRLLDFIAEGTASRSQLLFWDQLLVKTGQYLTDSRQQFFDFLNKRHETQFSYRIVYDKSIISPARLEQYKDAELGAKATLVGPHRDDFQMLLNKPQFDGDDTTDNFVDLNSYGSRGEQRLGILWLKLGELTYIQEKVQDRPVLLLDDIFSELDTKHRQYVLDLVKNYQTVITTADEDTEELLNSAGIEHTTVRFR